MPPANGFVDTPAVRLHYLDWGGDGPPLVLVHATGFHAHLWDAYAERPRARFRVIAIDQRGHGDSGMPRDGVDGFGWENFAGDLHALITALGIEGCGAAGHSSGGTAAGVCAGRYPGSIGRVLLIDPVLRGPDPSAAHRHDTMESPSTAATRVSPAGSADAPDSTSPPGSSGFPPGGPNPMADRTRRRRVVWDSPHQFEEAMRTRPAFARWRPEFLDAYAHHGLRRRADGHYELKCAPEVEARVYEGAIGFDPRPDLGRLAVPVLMLRATLNESNRAPVTPDVAGRIPGCHDQPVAATHFIPMEEPETVADAMDEFFGATGT